METMGFVIMQTNCSDLGKFAGFDAMGLYFPLSTENIKLFENEKDANNVKNLYDKEGRFGLNLKVVPVFAKISD